MYHARTTFSIIVLYVTYITYADVN